ncbi:hypothetical protein HJC23_001959 [Cyclotella cryptica]|uniref:Uncharacterized protein n=1 Tax=Cyclotella cryptica TaxID=29204 RepID=A0ABD3PQB8_9STRA
MNGSNTAAGLMTQADYKLFQSMVEKIGFEDCDYISLERSYRFWNETFPGGKLHHVPIELHVPCRDPIDHIISSCSWNRFKLDCHDITDEELFRIVDSVCPVGKPRYNHILARDFDIKCFDFHKQFTKYIDYMSTRLHPRRFESVPFIPRENRRNNRNKSHECIWEREDLMQKVKAHLLSNENKMHHQYYQFCNKCIESEHDLTRSDGPYGK